MLAQVKEGYKYTTLTACGGVQFTKADWKPVPAHEEFDAKRNSYLTTKAHPEKAEVSEEAQALLDQKPEDRGEKIEEINATDAAIKLAADSGINLSGVVGSGKEGRIQKNDVADLLAKQEAQTEEITETSAAADKPAE